MRILRGPLACAAAALLFASSPLVAQRGAVELGMDALGAWHDIDNVSNDLWEVAGPMGGLLSYAPLNGLRAGFFPTDRISLEPSLGFAFLRSGDDDVSHIGFSLTGLMYTHADNDRTRPFFGVGANVNAFDNEDQDMTGQFGLHGLVGARVPAVQDLGIRLAVGGGRAFETDEYEARWTVFVSAGLSYTVGGPQRPSVARR